MCVCVCSVFIRIHQVFPLDLDVVSTTTTTIRCECVCDCVCWYVLSVLITTMLYACILHILPVFVLDKSIYFDFYHISNDVRPRKNTDTFRSLIYRPEVTVSLLPWMNPRIEMLCVIIFSIKIYSHSFDIKCSMQSFQNVSQAVVRNAVLCSILTKHLEHRSEIAVQAI